MANDPRLERTFTYRLHRLHKLTDRATQAAHLATTGLRLGEARCLSAVGAFAPLSLKALAQHAHVDKGQASRAVHALVERGLVRKQGAAGDARGVVLTLTPHGHRECQRVMAVVRQRNAEIQAPLSATERRQLSALLDRLIDAAPT